MEDSLKSIIVISIVIAIIVIVSICIYFHNKYKSFVLQNSEQLQKVKKLNQNTFFHKSVEEKYFFTEALNSKRKLDNTSIYDFFIALIENRYDGFKSIIEQIKDNIRLNNDYLQKYNSIKSTTTEDFCRNLKTCFKKFLRYEKSLFGQLMLCPILDTEITIELTYTSPQGRNFYRKGETYDFSRFSRIFNEVTIMMENKQTRQYQIQLERAKMSDSLRYDILKRDNFRCQICGITASEGAKLHVDHIVPVSKGGKTIASNLRTLCDRCNMGKSNKIE